MVAVRVRFGRKRVIPLKEGNIKGNIKMNLEKFMIEFQDYLSARHDPRISSIVRAAKAVRCHVILIADEELDRLAVA